MLRPVRAVLLVLGSGTTLALAGLVLRRGGDGGEVQVQGTRGGETRA